MPVYVLTETVIASPREAVATFAADPSNAPRWYVNIREVDWKSNPPLARGSRVEFVARFLGRRLTYTYEVTDYVPNELLVMRTSEGPFPMETSYGWASMDDSRTRMTLRNRGEPGGLLRLFSPLVAAAMKRANRKDLARLKAILEGRTRSPV